jgi:glycosyltransferase involved in cell wall biosynthesis
MARKRILYIESNKDGTIGGSYISLLYLLQGLDKEKYEPVVMFCEPNVMIPDYEKVAEVMIYDFDPSVYMPVENATEAIRFIPKFLKHVVFKQPPLMRKLREIKPDLVHLNNGYIHSHEWMLACRLSGIPVIAHDRGSRPPTSRQSKLFSRLLDATISVSDAFLQNVLSENLKPRHACRVYNGLDTSMLDEFKSPQDRRRLRGELGVGEDEILIGTVGNIDYFKGQIVFVKAMREVLRSHGNVRSIIVGKTALLAEEYEEEIRRYIAENGLDDRIALLGFRKDVPALLNAMDIFVHASIGPEAFGRVILEAMAMAKPIIGTDGGGTPEQVIDHETGLLVPMNDVPAMAAALDELVSDMDAARRMGAGALRRLEENFTIAKMVEGVEEIYEMIFSED